MRKYKEAPWGHTQGGNPFGRGQATAAFPPLSPSPSGFAKTYPRWCLSAGREAGRQAERQDLDGILHKFFPGTANLEAKHRLRGCGWAGEVRFSAELPRHGIRAKRLGSQFPRCPRVVASRPLPGRLLGLPRAAEPWTVRGVRTQRALFGDGAFAPGPSWFSSLEIPKEGSICPCFRCHFLFFLGSLRFFCAAFPLGRIASSTPHLCSPSPSPVLS